MLDPNLSVNTVVSGLTEPTGLAFLGPNDFLVLEKSTGKVKRVVGGVAQNVVLDLAVIPTVSEACWALRCILTSRTTGSCISTGRAAARRRPRTATISTGTIRAISCKCRCSATAWIDSSGTEQALRWTKPDPAAFVSEGR